MAKIKLKENESIDDAILRFKRANAREGKSQVLREKRFYVKPGEKKRLKKQEAIRNNKKRKR